MAAAPRAQQVLQQQIALLPERYAGYHRDLIDVLNGALRAVGDAGDRTRRRRELSEAIKAKASQIKAGSDTP